MIGRTPGDEYGQFTFQTAQGHSTVDYFIASAQCMTAVQSLHLLEQAGRYHSDHRPLFLHFACESLTHSPVPTASESGARMGYDVQRAEAYQVALASELQQHFIPLMQHELDVDLLADNVACLTSAATNTMPHVRKGSGVVHSRKNEAWFDSVYRKALAQKESMFNNPHSTIAHQEVAHKKNNL